MPSFFENIRKEEDANRGFSINPDTFNSGYKVWFIYEGPYWGIWKYRCDCRKLQWSSWSAHEIEFKDGTTYTGFGTRKHPFKSPVGHEMLRAMGAKSWKGLMRNAAKRAIAISIAKYHKRYSRELLGHFERASKLLEQEPLKQQAASMYTAILVEFANFAGEEAWEYLEKYPQRLNDVITIGMLSNLGKDWRTRAWPRLIKEGTAKRALRKLKPSTPASIRNQLLGLKVPKHYAKYALLATKHLAEDDLREFSEYMRSHPHSRSRADREYLTKVAQLGGRNIGLLRDTIRQIEQCIYHGFELPEYIANFHRGERIPPRQIRAVHDTVTELYRNGWHTARAYRHSALDEEHEEHYRSMAEELDIPENMKLLVTRKEFMDEGTAMHHCIGSYFGHRNSLFFRIELNNQRASLQLSKYGAVQQLYGPCNQMPAAEIVALVEQFRQQLY